MSLAESRFRAGGTPGSSVDISALDAAASTDSLTDADACEQCASPLRPDQEWCIECGAARTLIHPPPDLRIAGGVAGLIVLAALVALIVALGGLTDGARTKAASALVRTVTVTVTGPGGSTTQPGSSSQTGTTSPSTGIGTTGTVGGAGAATAATGATTSYDGYPGWPIGLPGWTVVLAAVPTEPSARDLASQFRGRALSVGILHSDQHPQMTPGLWIVFLGRYPTYAAAHEGSLALHLRGFQTARPAKVASTGG